MTSTSEKEILSAARFLAPVVFLSISAVTSFTAVYDFYYGYDSKFKSSGDIKDKISWSCNVEYVGDDSDSSSSGSNYSDYRINGKAGESQKVSREDTVK